MERNFSVLLGIADLNVQIKSFDNKIDDPFEQVVVVTLNLQNGRVTLIKQRIRFGTLFYERLNERIDDRRASLFS